MREKHKELMDNNRIKIYNNSILDFNRKINQYCFVIGMEVLDNMPHDRLYLNEKGEFYQMATIKVTRNGEEHLEEIKTDITDPFCKEFVELYESMPRRDHIAANKVVQTEGIFKRIQEMF